MFTRWAKATCWLAIYRPCHGTPPHVYYKREAEVNGGDRAPVLNVCPHVDDDPVAWMDDEDKEKIKKKKKNTRTKEETSPAATPCRFYAYLCVRICQLHTLPAIYIRKEKGNGFSYLRLSPHYRKKKNFLLPPHQGVEKKEHCLWQRPTQTRVGLCRESCPRRLFSRADEKD